MDNVFEAVKLSGLNRKRRGTNFCDVSHRLRPSHKRCSDPSEQVPTERRREKRELVQITGAYSHIYNYNERASLEDTHGSTKGPHTRAMHKLIPTQCVVFYTYTHRHRRYCMKITHRISYVYVHN